MGTTFSDLLLVSIFNPRSTLQGFVTHQTSLFLALVLLQTVCHTPFKQILGTRHLCPQYQINNKSFDHKTQKHLMTLPVTKLIW